MIKISLLPYILYYSPREIHKKTLLTDRQMFTKLLILNHLKLDRAYTTSSVVVPVCVGDSLARVGVAMGAATASSMALCNDQNFGVAVTS